MRFGIQIMFLRQSEQFIPALLFKVNAEFPVRQFKIIYSWPFSAPVNRLAFESRDKASGHVLNHLFVHRLDEFHQRFIILKMLRADSLVSENFSDFKHLFKSADDQFFKRQFQRNPQINIHVKGVVTRHERLGIRSARNRFKRRRVNFHEAAFKQIIPKTLPKNIFLDEQLSYFGSHYQIQIPFSQPLFNVRQAVPFLRQRQERFREHLEIRNPQSNLSFFCLKKNADGFNEVTDVKIFQKEFVPLLA